MPDSNRGGPIIETAGARLEGSVDAHWSTLAPPWRSALAPLLDGPAVRGLCAFLDGELAQGKEIYPPRPLAALEQGGPQDVRVLVLGQDPYHGPGQAHGFAFSVPTGIRPPPSLRNIFAELAREGTNRTSSGGSLHAWARQGVLLLNAVMTVERALPGSHARRGWETVTDAMIDAIAAAPQPKVFLLWGAHAQAKRARIEAGSGPKLVLEANHPSPLSARRPPVPFLGCGHFSRANRYLAEAGCRTIDWSV